MLGTCSTSELLLLSGIVFSQSALLKAFIFLIVRFNCLLNDIFYLD